MHRVVLVTLGLVCAVVLFAACGGTQKKCNPQNCASGCCTVASNGDQICNPGTSTSLCGSGGAECIECASTQSCSLGACIDPGNGGGVGGGSASGGGTGGGSAGGTGGGGGGGDDAGTDGGTGGGTSDAGMSCWTGGGQGGGGGGGTPTPGYPATHPAFPAATSFGGSVLDSPKLIPITFNNYPADLQAEADCFVGSIGMTTYLTTTTSEYGMTGATGMTPVHLNEPAATSLTDQQIQAWLSAKINSADPLFPAPDSENLYIIFYPKLTHISYGGGHSCQDFGGYHGSTTDSMGNSYAYAVIPDCGNFIFNGLSEPDDISAASSHEIVEAITDPFVMNPAYGDVDFNHEIWAVVLLGEVGDLCAQDMASFYKPPGYAFEVQRTWSNANSDVAVGGDPCVPELPGEVYFNSVPVQPDNVHLTIQGQKIPTKGVKIPIGMTRTIDLQLFSRAPTDDWTIEAIDYGGMFGQSGQYLDLSLSKNTGNNGDTVQLTITNKAADGTGTGGAAFFILNSNNEGNTSYIGYVAPN